MSKSAAKVLGGAALGAVIGLAAGKFLASKKGQQMTKEMKETAEDFFDEIQPKLKELGEVTQDKYDDFMEEAVFKFSKLKKLSRQMTQHLLKEARHSWQDFAKEMKR